MPDKWTTHEILDPFGRTEGYTVIGPDWPAKKTSNSYFTTIKEMADDVSAARNAGDERPASSILGELGWYAADGGIQIPPGRIAA